MKCLFVLTVFLLFYQPADSQRNVTRRFVSYAQLTDPSNIPFQRWGVEISAILFEGVRTASIPLLHFDSFKKQPRPISWKELEDKLQKLDQLRFMPWKEGVQYPLGAEVSYGDYRYRSLIGNNDISPADYYSRAWEYLQPSHSIVGLDYHASPAGDRIIQYIHFYTDDLRYEGSFKASDAVNFLNATGYLWYRIENHIIHHLAGDIFLFAYNDPRNVYDLWPLLDTAKLKISKESIEGIGIRSGYNNGRVTEFVLTKEDSPLDTVKISEIRKSLDKDSTEFYLMGDALVKPGLLKFSESHPTIELKPFKMQREQISRKQVDAITYRTSETFKLLGQSTNPRAFEKNVGELLYHIYEGIAEQNLKIYSSDSLNKVYPQSELVKKWTVIQAPDNWEDKPAYYYSGDEVIYNGVVYVSLENDSLGGPPSENKEKWTVKSSNEEIFQPDDIQQFEFVYQVTFTKTGKQIRKEPFSIGLGCMRDYLVSTLGYLSFNELKVFITKKDPALWKKIAGWLEGQNGVYQMEGNSPIKAYKR